MSFDPAAVESFRYAGLDIDEGSSTVRCRYALDDLVFEEAVHFPGVAAGTWGEPAAEAARLIYLLAGVSYYKAAAPPVLDLAGTPLRPGEADFLRDFYVDGLGEFAYRNHLDLTGLKVVGGRPSGPGAAYRPAAERPLIPFGGGLDSIVTVEAVRPAHPDAALFVCERAGVRFEAIEDAAAVTGLPVVRAEREIDGQLLRPTLRFRNGHVPVTGILSAIAVTAAVLDGRSAVVMSNEWSASSGNVEVEGRVVNHQWSKSLAFEGAFRELVAGSVGGVEYFSWLRTRSELWIARRFAGLEPYHRVFRSCNRAFHLDPAARLDHWCGHCDKCVFIDLILAPFLARAQLEAVFAGHEPLADPALLDTFRSLLGISAAAKPFECVGEESECRAAVVLAARRPDRAGNPVLATLLTELGPAAADAADAVEGLLQPLGGDYVPDVYAR